MKEATHKKLDKKLIKLHDKLEKLIADVEDMHIIVIEACEQHAEAKEVKPAKRGRKGKQVRI